MRTPPLGRRTPRRRGRRAAIRWAACSLLALLTAAPGGAAEPPAPALHEGLAVERRLALGDSHSFPVDLAPGEVLRVTVDQVSLDVELRLLDPAGKEVAWVDGPGMRWPEDLVEVVETGGRYTLVVAPASRKRPSGSYGLHVTALRPALPADRLCAEAVAANQDAMRAMTVRGEDGWRHQEELRRKAARLWRQAGEARREAETLFELGGLHEKMQRYDESREELERSAALFRAAAEETGLAHAENEIGVVDRHVARHEEALAHYRVAQELFHRLDNREGEILVLSNLGLAQTLVGDAQRGAQSLERALALLRPGDDPQLQADTLLDLAEAYEELGRWIEAKHRFEKVVELTHGTRDRELARLERSALNGLSLLYDRFGDTTRALEFNDRHQQALPTTAQPDELLGERARALGNRGRFYQHAGDAGAARESFDSALEMARRASDREAETAALSNLAFFFVENGEPRRTVEICTQALASSGLSPSLQASILEALGSARRLLGEFPQATLDLQKARELGRNDPGFEARTALGLARIARDQGRLDEVLDLVRSARGTVERQRMRIVNEVQRASFLAARQGLNELEIDTLMALAAKRPERGYREQAFEVSERARARSLIELLGASGTDARKGADPELAERARQLRERVGARELERLDLIGQGADPAKLQEAGRRLNEALTDASDVEGELRAGSPGYAALTEPQPLGLPAIRAQVLDGKALLLEYWLGEEHSFLWAVTPDGLESFELPPRGAIEAVARRYVEQLTARNRESPSLSSAARGKLRALADAAAERAGAELSELVLAPVTKLLAGRPLLVVADGALQYIPFEALPIPGTATPVLSRNEVVSLPSASMLAVLRREVRSRAPAEKTLAVLADPVFQSSELPPSGTPSRRGASGLGPPARSTAEAANAERDDLDEGSYRRLTASRKEAEAISSLVAADRRRVWMRFDASRSTAIGGELAHFAYIHFATHGQLDGSHPERSSLILSLVDPQGRPQNGYLRLDDVYNLHLNARLVVLSACKTALGKTIRGEGLIGLTRGFMYAGAERVVASLWSIEDRSTAKLMQLFYAAMLHDGKSPAAALRWAQGQMASDKVYSAPYYWAGFSLQGEWE